MIALFHIFLIDFHDFDIINEFFKVLDDSVQNFLLIVVNLNGVGCMHPVYEDKTFALVHQCNNLPSTKFINSMKISWINLVFIFFYGFIFVSFFVVAFVFNGWRLDLAFDFNNRIIFYFCL